MYKKYGFTLIELLVVVLIIGILSAVALPQYQKAVEKSRLTELMTIQNSLEKAVEVYLLANGGASSSESIVDSLDISFPDFQKKDSWLYCNAKDICFGIRVYSSDVDISVARWPGLSGNPSYILHSYKSSYGGMNKWNRRYSNCGMSLSKFGLESLGYGVHINCD